ncbi:MAG: tripartite tricarboxylate transporter substrate-binding protein [Hyphomicrobiaceae bacterium]
MQRLVFSLLGGACAWVFVLAASAPGPSVLAQPQGPAAKPPGTVQAPAPKPATKPSGSAQGPSVKPAKTVPPAPVPKAAAQAPWQPTKPIEFVIMAGKGGGADRIVRNLIGTIVKHNLAPVEFTPVNIAGGSGADAMDYLNKKKGDEHLLLFTLNSFYTTPLYRPDLNIDIAAFAPIGLMAEDTFLLWVHSNRTDIKTIDDFVKAARAKGDKWVMAGTGTGQEDSLLTDFLNSTYGLKMSYTSFEGGGDVAKELAEKRADSTVNNPAEQNDFFPKGLTKPIAAFTPKRLQMHLRVPTFRETGMDFTYFMQRSVVGAPGMSAPAQAYYFDLFKKIFATPEWQAYRTKNSLGGDFLSGSELMNYWLKERQKHERWKMAVEALKR